MYRTFLLINIIFLSIGIYANPWLENDLSVSGGVTALGVSFIDEITEVNSANILVATTQLNEGWGYKIDHLSQLSDTNQNSFYSHSSSLSARAFITESASIEIGATTQDLLMNNGLFVTRNRSAQDVNYEDKSNVFSGTVDVAKDNQFWNMYLGIRTEDSELSYLLGDVFLKSNKIFIDSQFEWQITEDSFLTSRGEGSKSSLDINQDSVDVISTYLGFKTRYLGSSELLVFLGDSTSSENSGIFSWQITNVIKLNEYSKILISSKRILQETDDERFNVKEATSLSVKGDIKYSDVWSFNFLIESLNEELSEEVSAERVSMSSKINMNMLEQWLVSFSYAYDDYSDDRYGYTENSIKLELIRDFL